MTDFLRGTRHAPRITEVPTGSGCRRMRLTILQMVLLGLVMEAAVALLAIWVYSH